MLIDSSTAGGGQYSLFYVTATQKIDPLISGLWDIGYRINRLSWTHSYKYLLRGTIYQEGTGVV